ncbi:MAG: SAM-dependent methyltransferase [Verrucomicrobia bacterium]|nr:SAM-dependent methyltransferase [Verrucomicrobiota bacterium]
MNALVEIIRHEIAEHGPMPFARFMELALYHPKLGYYEHDGETIGRGGDFFTSVSVGSVFGELLAVQFAQWLDELVLLPKGTAVESCNVKSLAPVPPHEPDSTTDDTDNMDRSASSSAESVVKKSVQEFKASQFSVNSLPGLLLHSQGGEGESQGHLESQRPLQIVEAGAHDGRLAFDVLSWVREHRPDLLQQLEYWILEPSTVRRRRQAQTLSRFEEHIRWFTSWEFIPLKRVRGVIYANELLDALPVHRLGWNAAEQRWFEWAVTWEKDHFTWTKLSAVTVPSESGSPRALACFDRRLAGRSEPPDRTLDGEVPDRGSVVGEGADHGTRGRVRSPFHLNLPPELAVALPDGFTIEVGPAAEAWWSQAASRLAQGKLLTIDYGLLADEFFTPQRANGTLRGYHRHHVSSDLLSQVGEQDLTSHINFSALLEIGAKSGLRTEALIPQSKFLTEIVKQIERSPQSFPPWTPARLRQFQTLTHPEHLGRPFQVLCQSR